MYQITYKKQNGEVFNRIRNTLPHYKIGSETSMGWIILDIKYCFDNKYYSFVDYKKLLHKSHKRNAKINKIKIFIKKYATTFALIILLPLYLLK